MTQEMNYETIQHCRFVVWNWKCGKYLPCEVLFKLDDDFIRVVEYEEKNGEVCEIYTTLRWSDIKNNPKYDTER